MLPRRRRRIAAIAAIAALATAALPECSAAAGGCEVGAEGVCALMGDPHILTFDTSHGPSRLATRPGVFWLVKSEEVQVQGLFRFTNHFPGVASLTGLVVTGDAIGGHMLKFEYTGPAEWQTGTRVTFDNQEVLAGFPSEYVSHGGMFRGRKYSLDPASAHKVGGTLPAYEFHLGREAVFIFLLMGPDFANAAIRLRKGAGVQDGICGNWNCAPADDDEMSIEARGFGEPLRAAESFFGDVPGLDAQPVRDSSCDAALEAEARRICQDAGSRDMVEACVYDTCRSGSARVAPVLEAIERMLWQEVEKLRPAPPLGDPKSATEIHVGCPCGGDMSRTEGEQAMPCHCAQAHLQTCPCMHDHTNAAACHCLEEAMSQCPCMQVAKDCPCEHPPVVALGLDVAEPPVGPTAFPAPLMVCELNCYGESAQAVGLPGASGEGDAIGVQGVSLEMCRDFCLQTPECDGIVFGSGGCYGKRDIVTSKCQGAAGVFSTEILRNAPRGVCGLFGDPHIVPFDGPTGDTIDQFKAGEYVLLRSAHFQVNGRFGYSRQFPEEASVVGLAVAGAALEGHRLVVQYVGPGEGASGFKVYWDEKPILKKFPSAFKSEDGTLFGEAGEMDPDAEHPKMRHTIGGEPGSGALPSYRFSLVPGTRIYVLLGPQSMNVVIEAHQQLGGVDGYCGNFNCRSDDDGLEALDKRGLAAAVPAMQTLFVAIPPPPAFEMEEVKPPLDLAQCDDALRSKADTICAEMPPSQHEDCVYDVCASRNIERGTEDVKVSRLEEHMGVDIGAFLQRFWRGWDLVRGQGELAPRFYAGVGLVISLSLLGCAAIGCLSRGHRRGYRRVRLSEGGTLRHMPLPGVGRLFGSFARDMRFNGYFSDEVASEHVPMGPCAGNPLMRHSFDEGDAPDEREGFA